MKSVRSVPFPHVIIGVEHSGNVLCQVTVQYSLDVVAMVDWVHGENMSSVNSLCVYNY